ncbi:DNA polymerase III subunit chi [Methylicorpusculum oleiharenae]|uniref:DNA polymerase III subunit chi n=1 Tax=Methylicorpusculum oleiharenae TaxID=1338687 RepID=UPI00135A33B4|nr:DNA polymerase III subunit chi [Methylicorpusculum oleiharenae]MCD2450300.1 DNA polymerase III subunit chi [Methylicorpusculum oleiharenae]
MAGVSFYILEQETEQEKYIFACKLIEKAYRQGQFSFVLTKDDRQSQIMDDLLWSFRPGSFIPHDKMPATAKANTPRVLIGKAPPTDDQQTLLVNLSENCPDMDSQNARIIEIIENDETAKAVGRARYKQYQSAGFSIETHRL